MVPPQRLQYKVIAPGLFQGQILVLDHIKDDGTVVLIGGGPWSSKLLGFNASELEAVKAEKNDKI